jgi:AraC family transcriptional regulator
MTRCDFELGGDHEVLGIAVPASLTSAMLADVEPGFPGHFRGLHESAWRDNGVRDLALTIWRASKGDAQAPDIDPDEALMRLTMRLLHLSGQPLSKRRCNDRLAPHVARRLMEFIEANIDDDLSVFRLATVACLSPYHFARAFRHDFGDTPHAYVQRRRLARACDLIRHGRFGLAEIALAVGYSSQSRMNEVFARELGTTPGSYRRQMRL